MCSIKKHAQLKLWCQSYLQLLNACDCFVAENNHEVKSGRFYIFHLMIVFWDNAQTESLCISLIDPCLQI